MKYFQMQGSETSKARVVYVFKNFNNNGNLRFLDDV